MKTIFTTLLFIFSFTSNAQQEPFIVTQAGLRSASDTSQPAVIISLDSTSSYLYSMSNKYIQQTFKNPDYVIKGKVENEYLRYDVYASHIIDFKIKKQSFPINATYTVELKFKDKKIRYELINVELISENKYPLFWVKTGSSWKGWSRQHIFDTDGSIEYPVEKKAIEDYFNGKVEQLRNFIIQNKNSW